MNPNPTHKLSKKEEIRLRAVQILIDSLTGDGFDKIRKIVCSNGSNDNESNRFEKSTKIFHIIFSPESIQALIKNMKLTGVAKSGIEFFKATNRLSSLFSSKKTTTRRKTTTNASGSRSRTSDLVISQVDTYLKADSVLIIKRAFESLVKSCNTPDVFSSVVRSQCVEPIIKHIMNKGGENIVNYFDGGGGGGGSKKTTRLFKKASRRRRHRHIRTRTRIRH
jgi:hypothetical protein